MAPSPHGERSPKLWFITGCSSGLGREIALAALAAGHRVVATARRVETLADLERQGAHVLTLDVTHSDAQVARVVHAAVEAQGVPDILVNNAGVCTTGAIEAYSEQEVREVFDTNVFGTLRVTRAVLPYLRARRSGVVANMGSLGGRVGVPLMGMYGATKFALAGLTLALRDEVAPLGVDVLLLEPGFFRTKALTANAKTPDRALDGDVARATQPMREFLAGVSGNESGDPAKAGKFIVEVLARTGWAQGKALPGRLTMGKDAAVNAQKAMQADLQEQRAWQRYVSDLDFDDPKTATDKLRSNL